MTTAPESHPPAASRDLEADRTILRAIRAIAVAGDMARAAALADEALNRGLEHPFLLNLSAVGLESAGRFHDALARLQRAAELALEAWKPEPGKPAKKSKPKESAA